MDTLKRLEKDSEISQDDRKSMSDDIQSITDEYVKKVDDTLAAKESEITTV